MGELDGIIMKNFYRSQDTTKCVKEHSREWEKVFVILTFDKGPLQVNFFKKADNQNENWAKI